MTIHCPCCGHEIAAARAPIEALAAVPLSHIQRRIVDAMVKAYPGKIGVAKIVDAVYWDDPDGGPLEPERVLQQIIYRLRLSLTAYGWTIPASPGGRGHHGLYGLAPVEQR
jgi:hypothetical protein